jgi:hypothetical protein
MTKLATTTVDGSAPTSVTFTNIPQGYTDLKLIVSARSTRSGVDRSNDIFVRLNGISSGYILKCLGDSPPRSTTSSSDTGMGRIQAPSDDATAGIFGNAEITVHNYSGNRYKIMSADSAQEDSATYAAKWFVSSQVPTTAPITSVTFIADQSATLQQHSTFTIYGIKNARQTAGNSIKATGGNIVFDGTYVYHTFTSTGAFIPTSSFRADYLVVAGGGSGANSVGYSECSGGGGAGGYRTTVGTSGGGGAAETPVYLNASIPYAVTIGAGGAGKSTYGAGNQGNASEFFTINSRAGGAAGADGGGSAGGSGGGAGTSGGVDRVAGLGTAGQGYDGGSSKAVASPSNSNAGGGGGGAGGVGVAGASGVAGNGGPGLTAFDGNVYAGGGGGNTFGSGGVQGSGGSGIGGSGISTGTSGNGGNGRVNTGSGGGACGASGSVSGAGGSGIVIIRYKG